MPDQGQLEPAPALSPSGVHSHETPRPPGSILRDQASSYFIGFSWGPKADAFTLSQPSRPSDEPQPLSPAAGDIDLHTTTPRANRHDPSPTPHKPFLGAYNTIGTSTPSRHHHPPITPLRRLQTPHTPHQPFATPYNRNTNPYAQGLSTIRRTVSAAAGPGTAPRPARAVSDREAMRQLVDCIGLSARKKVFASGRTPRSVIKEMRAANGHPDSGGSGSAHSKGKAPLKALRFVPAPVDIAAGKAIGPGKNIIVGGSSMSLAEDGEDVGAGNSSADSSGIAGISKINSSSNSGGTGNSLSAGGGANASTSQLNHSALWNPDDGDGSDDNLHRRDVVAERVIVLGASTSTSGSSVPPSPSPSPRPGSAMSLLSRRSATPTTATGTWSLRLPVSASVSGGLRPSSPWLASGSMSRSRSRSLSEQVNRMDESAVSRIWEGESQHGAGGAIGTNDEQEQEEEEQEQEQEVPTPRPPKRTELSPPHSHHHDRPQHKNHKPPRDSTHDAHARRSTADPRSESPPHFVFGEPNNASSPPRPRHSETQQQRHHHHHQPRRSSNPARTTTTTTTKPATTTTAPSTTTTSQPTRPRPRLRTSFERLDELDRRYEALMEDLATLEKRMASARRRAATVSDYRTRLS